MLTTRHETKRADAPLPEWAERRLAHLRLPPEEQHAIGLELARRAEAACRPAWADAMAEAGAPTDAELAAEAGAAAAWEAARDATRAARAAAVAAEREEHAAHAAVGGPWAWDATASGRNAGARRRAGQATDARRAAERALREAEREEADASRLLQRARGATMRAGAARQAAFVARGFRP